MAPTEKPDRAADLSGWQLLLGNGAALQWHTAAPIEVGRLDAALLAWLALEGPTPRARIAALLWPDRDADAARNSLRQRIFQLHKRVGAEVVHGSTTLALAKGVAHDLEESHSVLGDVELTVGGEFAQWLEAQRSRRRARLRASLVDLAEMAEARRDWDDALSHAHEILALEPLAEDAFRRLMRLHYLRGERAAALLAFDRCEQLLKHEVGVRPSVETLALLATIEHSPAAAAAAPAAAAGGPRAVPACVQRPPRLIGRERAWCALHAAWDEHRCAVITGDAGLGKSRLATDFARARGATLAVSARPGDERVVYASFSRLLRALPMAALQALAPALRSALARLLPELEHASGALPVLRDDADRTRFFNAVTAALDSDTLALEGIVFDDLQFADDASVELLQYVAAGSKLHWLIAARHAEVSAPGRAWLDGLMGQTGTHCVALEPLALPQITELLDSLGIASLAGAEHAPALLRHTGGNPLYLLETIKAWLTQEDARLLPNRLPAAANIRHLIERRIGHLSMQAVQLARCAAIAAPDFSIELASHVLGLRTLDLADPWAELEAAQVLCDGAFAHDLIYESALASVPQPVARRLHAEIAEYLHAHGGEPVRLALHWTHAGHWPQAGAAYRAAADRARDASRLFEQSALLAEAAACFDRAGCATERYDALLERARLLASNDLGTEASAAVAALDAAAESDEQRMFALAVRLELTMTRYEIDDAMRLARQAIDQARALGRADLELRFAIILAGAMCDAREAADAVVRLEPYAPWVQAHAPLDQQWEYWEASALALDYANRLREALPAWDEARAVAQRAGRRDLTWKTMSNSASTQAKLGLVHEAAQAAGAAHQLALASGEAASMRVLQVQVTLAHRLRDIGRYGEALRFLEHALAGYEAGGASHSDKALVEQRLVVLFQQLGQPARATPLLAHARPGVPRGVAMIRLAHQAELEHLMGRDGATMMREALRIVPNPDDIYHRITTLFATRLVPPDEGEVLAASLAAWATTRERHGVALSGHVRAAACAMALGAAGRARPHVEAALHLARTFRPDSFYLAELWLVAAQVSSALDCPAEAARAVTDGLAWIKQVHDEHVPDQFRDSFLHRNPVNRELLSLSALKLS